MSPEWGREIAGTTVSARSRPSKIFPTPANAYMGGADGSMHAPWPTGVSSGLPEAVGSIMPPGTGLPLYCRSPAETAASSIPFQSSSTALMM